MTFFVGVRELFRCLEVPCRRPRPTRRVSKKSLYPVFPFLEFSKNRCFTSVKERSGSSGAPVGDLGVFLEKAFL